MKEVGAGRGDSVGRCGGEELQSSHRELGVFLCLPFEGRT